MDNILKGFFLGIFFVIVFTLIIAPMMGTLIQTSSGQMCGYGCSVQKLLDSYKSPLFLILFGAFWILGSSLFRLSSSIQRRGELMNLAYSKHSKEFKWPWEHTLTLVEDKENY